MTSFTIREVPKRTSPSATIQHSAGAGASLRFATNAIVSPEHCGDRFTVVLAQACQGSSVSREARSELRIGGVVAPSAVARIVEPARYPGARLRARRVCSPRVAVVRTVGCWIARRTEVLAVAVGPLCCFTAMPAMVMVAAGSAAFSFRARS